MIVNVLYRHETEKEISLTVGKKADTDELYLNFIADDGETLPFPNGETTVPFNAFVQWFNERTQAAKMLTDEQAAIIPTLYPLWFVGEAVKLNDRRLYEDKLYKCLQEHTSQADWTPDKTPALWVTLDVQHKGTIDDPIPAARGMEYTYGLYYCDSEDGKTYLCERQGEAEGGTIVLHFMPHEVVGHYFVEVNSP